LRALAVLLPEPADDALTAVHITPPDLIPEYPKLESVDTDRVLLEEAVDGAANGSPRCAIAPTYNQDKREQYKNKYTADNL